MDYQELEAFKKMSQQDRELKMVQDIDETKTMVKQLLESKECPYAGCPMKKDMEVVKDDVSRLKDHEKIVIGVVVVGVLGSGVLVWVLTKLFGG